MLVRNIWEFISSNKTCHQREDLLVFLRAKDANNVKSNEPISPFPINNSVCSEGQTWLLGFSF